MNKKKLPVHNNPSERERRSHAPYNFVQLTGDVLNAVESPRELPSHDAFHADLYSGFFDVKMTTKTPIFIRGLLTEEEFEQGENVNEKDKPFRKMVKNKPDFFHLGNPDKPIIPGSSLRGMIRSVFEIVTLSKMDFVDDRKLIFRAVGDYSSLGDYYRKMFLTEKFKNHKKMEFDYPSHAVKGGYLKKIGNKYYIRPAECHENESFVHVEYDTVKSEFGELPKHIKRRCFVKPVKRSSSDRGNRNGKNLILNLAISDAISATPKPGFVEAYLIISGYMGGKHKKHLHCAVYKVDGNAEPLEVTKEMWKLYKDDHEKSQGREVRELKDEEPLFYMVNKKGELVYFGPTKFFRIPHKHSIKEFLPDVHKSPDSIDMAEALFGFVNKRVGSSQDKDIVNSSYASRIRVSKAELEKGQSDIYLDDPEAPGEPIVPKILGTPKPTAFQHYLTQKNPDDKNELNHYSSPPIKKTVLRGWKKYWHHDLSHFVKKDELAEQISENSEPGQYDKQHTIIRPLRQGLSFRFRVSFENLKKEELGALSVALDPKPEPKSKHCHKIGMGKPYGLGSVELNSELYIINRIHRYSELINRGKWSTGIEKLEDNEFREVFFQYVVREDGEKKQAKDVFFRNPQIKDLMAMMKYPGPDPERLEYVRKESSRQRAVLPQPEDVDPIKTIPQPHKNKTKKGTKPTSVLPKSRSEIETVELIRKEGDKIIFKTKNDEIAQCEELRFRYMPFKSGQKLKVNITRKNGEISSVKFKKII